jgi:hypothetical protein
MRAQIQIQIQKQYRVRALVLGSKGFRLLVAIASMTTTTRSSPKATAVTAGGRVGTTWCVGSGSDRPDVDVWRGRERERER